MPENRNKNKNKDSKIEDEEWIEWARAVCGMACSGERGKRNSLDRMGE